MPKSEVPKMDKMFVVVPNMEVNFPADSKIKSRILAVESQKAPSRAFVRLPVGILPVPITHFARITQNIECEICDFKVTDGPIKGNFTVKDELILKTKSGAIDANITSTDARRGPIVDITTTTTGSINTNFTLVVVDPETEEKVPSGGFFHIVTRSRRGQVRLEIVDAPIDYVLDLWSKNAWGSFGSLVASNLPRQFPVRSSHRRQAIGPYRRCGGPIWAWEEEEPFLERVEHSARCHSLVGRSTSTSIPLYSDR